MLQQEIVERGNARLGHRERHLRVVIDLDADAAVSLMVGWLVAEVRRRLDELELHVIPVLFGQATAYYRTPPLPMLQVCWPDPNEHFVWDAETSDSLHSLHPQLWLPPADHPASPWTTLAKGN